MQHLCNPLRISLNMAFRPPSSASHNLQPWQSSGLQKHCIYDWVWSWLWFWGREIKQSSMRPMMMTAKIAARMWKNIVETSVSINQYIKSSWHGKSDMVHMSNFSWAPRHRFYTRIKTHAHTYSHSLALTQLEIWFKKHNAHISFQLHIFAPLFCIKLEFPASLTLKLSGILPLLKPSANDCKQLRGGKKYIYTLHNSLETTSVYTHVCAMFGCVVNQRVFPSRIQPFC